MGTIRQTTRSAWSDLQAVLPQREATVLEGLRLFCLERHYLPTSYELVNYMIARDMADDLNTVRPRLTGLQERGMVRTGHKRPCGVTGKMAYVWELAPTEPPAAPAQPGCLF